jgi:hypothetical protein
VILEWCDVAQDLLCRTTLSWCHIIGMRGKTHQCKQRKQRDCLMFIHSYFHFQWHSFKISCSCMVYIKKKHCRMIVQWHRKWSDSDVTLVIERQQLTWHHVQNVVSLRVLYKFVNFYLTLQDLVSDRACSVNQYITASRDSD